VRLLSRRGRHAEAAGAVARAFTLVEVLFSILIIGILLALLIGGVTLTTRVARSTADRQALSTIRIAISQFEKEAGFIPPLVRDRAQTPAWTEPGSGGTRRVAVYAVQVPAQALALRVPTQGPTAANPLLDNRYSESSLAYYLVGALERSLVGAAGIPIDGVPGPGLYKPRADGTFEIPADVRSGSAESQRVGSIIRPLVEVGKSSPKLATSAADVDAVQMVDNNNVAFRYYRWLPGREQPAGSGNFIVETLGDLNIPVMVARDPAAFPQLQDRPERDITKNAQLRDATYALVSAGANRVFGDEPLAELQAALGSGTEIELRREAESDNGVEVGS
jgi:prepilin-type N-terminal cleavage/methylation domain-containing protein